MQAGHDHAAKPQPLQRPMQQPVVERPIQCHQIEVDPDEYGIDDCVDRQTLAMSFYLELV